MKQAIAVISITDKGMSAIRSISSIHNRMQQIEFGLHHGDPSRVRIVGPFSKSSRRIAEIVLEGSVHVFQGGTANPRAELHGDTYRTMINQLGNFIDLISGRGGGYLVRHQIVSILGIPKVD